MNTKLVIKLTIPLIGIVAICAYIAYNKGFFESKPKVNKDELTALVGKMVEIPAGNISIDIAGKLESAHAQGHVKSFYMAEAEVTIGLWKQCQAEKGCSRAENSSADYATDKHPVALMWANLEYGEFLSWLRKKTGLNFRYPSELEWLYAANGSQNHLKESFSCDKSVIGMAFYRGSPGCDRVNGKHIQVVKSKPANSFGLYDMFGNVNEVTLGCGSFKENVPSDCSNTRDYTILGGHNNSRPNTKIKEHIIGNKLTSGANKGLTGFRLALDYSEYQKLK